MKYKIPLIIAMFLIAPCAYSQHLANAMPVDIPLNSTKESAIQTLLNKGYWINDTWKDDDYKILEYKNKGGYKVRLWTNGNLVSIVSWELYFPSGAELLFNSSELEGIELELKDVYGLEPYATSVKRDDKGSLINFWNYYHWKGNTIILSPYELFILSNADAERRYQKERQVLEKEEKERRMKQERERQEQINRQNAIYEREKREAEEKQRQVHINSLKSSYSSCRILFASEESFVSCITQDNQKVIEKEIKTLIDKKMAEISNIIVKGTEFKDQYYARNIMEGICKIPNNISDVSPAIANYAENKMMAFVSARKALNKAHNKAKKKNPDIKCSEFLKSYINDNGKSYTENTSGKPFVMANGAYSIAPQTTLGLTIGSIKKIGYYASINSNFRFKKYDFECDQTGVISELTSEYSYSGDKKTSCLGVTVGLVGDIGGGVLPIYSYMGCGYGFRSVYWKLDNGCWAKCIDDSCRGISLEAGYMVYFGNFGLSFGIQTIGVRYMEAKIGLGYTFYK